MPCGGKVLIKRGPSSCVTADILGWDCVRVGQLQCRYCSRVLPDCSALAQHLQDKHGPQAGIGGGSSTSPGPFQNLSVSLADLLMSKRWLSYKFFMLYCFSCPLLVWYGIPSRMTNLRQSLGMYVQTAAREAAVGLHHLQLPLSLQGRCVVSRDWYRCAPATLPTAA